LLQFCGDEGCGIQYIQYSIIIVLARIKPGFIAVSEKVFTINITSGILAFIRTVVYVTALRYLPDQALVDIRVPCLEFSSPAFEDY